MAKNIDDRFIEDWGQQPTMAVVWLADKLPNPDPVDTKAYNHFKQALYSDILELIGEDESYIDLPEVDATGNITKIYKGKTYTTFMVARNQLRADQRQALKEYFNL